MWGWNMKRVRRALIVLCSSLLAFGICIRAALPDHRTIAGVMAEDKARSESMELFNAVKDVVDTETAAAENRNPAAAAVTISAVGDCTFGVNQKQWYENSFHEYYDLYGADYFMENVRGIFAADDFTLVNLECVFTESEEAVEKSWNMKGFPEYTKIMAQSSIEGCSHGNNHCMDYGLVSLNDTHAALDEAGIVYGYNEHTAVYTTESGIRIGIVSANLLSETEEFENYIRYGIASLREQGADLVIASCHWGYELDNYPTDYQQRMGHNCIDWGADLVIGTHPHVLQGIEYYNGKVICYSLGNFCFGGNRNPTDKDTVIYQQTFTFIDGQLQPQLDARVIPCMVSSHSSYNDFQPMIAEEEEKQSIIERVNEYSAPYGGTSFDAEGIMLN